MSTRVRPMGMWRDDPPEGRRGWCVAISGRRVAAVRDLDGRVWCRQPRTGAWWMASPHLAGTFEETRA